MRTYVLHCALLQFRCGKGMILEILFQGSAAVFLLFFRSRRFLRPVCEAKCGFACDVSGSCTEDVLRLLLHCFGCFRLHWLTSATRKLRSLADGAAPGVKLERFFCKELNSGHAMRLHEHR